MSVATLRVRPRDGFREVVVDCPHGTSTGFYANGRGAAFQLTDDDVTRACLLKHLEEQPACRCIRRLWRRSFGSDWPTVKIA